MTRNQIETRIAEIEDQLKKAQRGVQALARLEPQEAVTEQERQLRNRINELEAEAGFLRVVVQMMDY